MLALIHACVAHNEVGSAGAITTWKIGFQDGDIYSSQTLLLKLHLPINVLRSYIRVIYLTEGLFFVCLVFFFRGVGGGGCNK